MRTEIQTITLEALRACNPCREGWRRLVQSLPATTEASTPFPFLHILDSNGIPDTLWGLRALPNQVALYNELYLTMLDSLPLVARSGPLAEVRDFLLDKVDAVRSKSRLQHLRFTTDLTSTTTASKLYRQEEHYAESVLCGSEALFCVLSAHSELLLLTPQLGGETLWRHQAIQQRDAVIRGWLVNRMGACGTLATPAAYTPTAEDIELCREDSSCGDWHNNQPD